MRGSTPRRPISSPDPWRMHDRRCDVCADRRRASLDCAGALGELPARETRVRRTESCNWRSCMPSSRRCTRFLTATAAWDACWCHCSCHRAGIPGSAQPRRGPDDAMSSAGRPVPVSPSGGAGRSCAPPVAQRWVCAPHGVLLWRTTPITGHTWHTNFSKQWYRARQSAGARPAADAEAVIQYDTARP